MIVGPGAIGGFVAARLTKAGWPVSVVARGATLAALRAGPLTLTDADGERRVPLRAVGDPREAGPSDLALVCVKSFDTGAAGRALAPALAPGAVILSLQNGVENPAALTRECPHAAVGGVAVYLGCQRLAPDHVVRRPSRDPSTGRLRDLLAGGGAGAPGQALAAVGAAIGVPVRVDDDPALALWSKLVANVALNTVTALGRARVGPVLADPHAVGLMLALGREVVAVAHAAGVPVAPDAAEAYVADARVGSVVRQGERLGVAVPVSRACDALLRLQDPGAPSA